jgi:hypothetical protein
MFFHVFHASSTIINADGEDMSLQLSGSEQCGLELLPLLLHIQEVLDLRPGPETSYPD